MKAFIKNTMQLWKTNLEANFKSQIAIKCRTPSRCTVSTTVLHTPEPLQPDHHEKVYGHRFGGGATISYLL